MWLLAVARLALTVFFVVASNAEIDVDESIRCNTLLNHGSWKHQKYTVLRGLIGYGHDYLLGKHTSMILRPSYHDCNTIDKSIILDYVVAADGHGVSKTFTPKMYNSIEEMEIDAGSDFGMHASGGFGPFTMGGMMSSPMKKARASFGEGKKLYRDVTTYHAFTLSIRDNPGFGLRFSQALEEIRSARNARHSEYHAQMLVQEFGTHVIIKEDIGDISTHDSYSEKPVESTPLKKLLEELEAFDRAKEERYQSFRQEGITLSSVINRGNLPDWTRDELQRVQYWVNKALKTYQDLNMRGGCRHPLASNFDANATMHTGRCHFDMSTIEFGGMFYDSFNTTDSVKNVETNNVSCPPHFKTVSLYADTQGQYFWCKGNMSTQFPAKVGVLYGKMDFYRCSAKTNATKVGRLYYCALPKLPQNVNDSSPFGGFFSCQSNNSCPEGYEQNEIAIIDDCTVYVCVKPSMTTIQLTKVLQDEWLSYSSLPTFVLNSNETLEAADSQKELRKSLTSSDACSLALSVVVMLHAW